MPYFLLALLLALIGWGGLVALILFTLPTLGPRWLLFFLTLVAFTGTAIPVTYFLNRRFPSKPPAEYTVVVRQAMWFGIYGCTLAWLQLGRMFSVTVAGVLAVSIILIEGLLRMREISRWKPKNSA